MKKILVIFLSLILSVSVFAENEKGEENTSTSTTTIVNGSVIDGSTGESLAGVEIKVVGTDIVVYTDFDGNFEITNLKSGMYDIVISYISYNSTLIENIELQNGTNSLNDIRLIAN